MISVRNRIISKSLLRIVTGILVISPRLTWPSGVNHLSNNWGDKVENCKLSFSQLYKLAPTSNVKADIAKVRGARGPNYVYKAESLAVELSGSSDDDN